MTIVYAVRPARPDDVPAVVAMVHELAGYERAAHECHLSASQLHAALFPAGAPALFAHVAVDAADVPMGVALWFLNFSTWAGVHGIYLEDLYVRPAARGSGAGRALLATLAGICLERGYHRLEWWVLESPELDGSRAFYRRIGGRELREWVPWRVTGKALRELAAGAPPDLDLPAV